MLSQRQVLGGPTQVPIVIEFNKYKIHMLDNTSQEAKILYMKVNFI